VTAALDDPAALAARLQRFEERLDPAHPGTADAGVEIVGYGEVSTAFALAALPGQICKRMAGFPDTRAVERYVEVVRRYLDLLRQCGVAVADTQLVPVAPGAGAPVVYLVQPRLSVQGLGHHLLREADESTMLACIDHVLAIVGGLLRRNRAVTDGRTITVDAQLSNWWFAVDGVRVGAPILFDVGTPYMRLRGIDEVGVEVFLAPMPPPVRWYCRRQRVVERYLDDYFDARHILLDLVGNFYKEGRPDRIPWALERINQWLATDGADLGARALSVAAVERYYAKDAAALEWFLKVRRADRFIRTRLLRRRYDFLLPGPVRRARH
jgi:uncharacterized protein DUF6206